LKPERWGSPLVQENYWEEQVCDKRHPYNNNNNNNSNKRNAFKEEAEKILKYKTLNRNTAHMECKDTGDTSNNGGDWDYFKNI